MEITDRFALYLLLFAFALHQISHWMDGMR